MHKNDFFSEDVLCYLKCTLHICSQDLVEKISNDAPESFCFFNKLFKFMMELEVPYSYDNDNLSNPNNSKNREYLNGQLCEFFYEYKYSKESTEYSIFDSIRHAFIHFKEGGILQMYQCREAEVWYPKVIINKFIGKDEDINSLNEPIKIYRGTSIDEFESKVYGQSWSLSEEIAHKFAFEHYRSQNWFQIENRLVLSSEISKCDIFYYDKYGQEQEIIVDVSKLMKVDKSCQTI